MQVDPIGLAAGPNVYAYCNGSPADTVDPSGLLDLEKVERGIWSIFQGSMEFLAYMPSTSLSAGNVVMMGKGLGDIALGINKVKEGFRGDPGMGAAGSVAEQLTDWAAVAITGSRSQKARDVANLADTVFSTAAVSRGPWWRQGAGNDAYWRSLSPGDKAYYEIGQKSLTTAEFQELKLLDPVTRGKALVQRYGWRGALTPGVSGYGSSFWTGPTPAVRSLFTTAAAVRTVEFGATHSGSLLSGSGFSPRK